MDQSVERKLAGETEVLAENLPYFYFLHHKTNTTRPGLEPEPPLWKARDKPPELWCGHCKSSKNGHELGCRVVGVRIPVGARFVSSPHRPDRFCSPTSLLADGYREFFWGVKRPGREADYSLPTNAEVKITWIYTSTPQ
jgi:hypothetical protein